MVGILVHGNNHFILCGPVPDEAVALALARHWSIIQIGETKSAQGKAGTLQEIFQDAVRNYYRAPAIPFSPMVFYDKKYWTRTLPAAGLLEKLFTRNKRGPDYKKYVLVTSDEQEAIDFIVTNAPPANSQLRRLKSLGLLS